MVSVSEREAILTPESLKENEKKNSKKPPNLSEVEITIEELLGHIYIMNNIK